MGNSEGLFFGEVEEIDMYNVFIICGSQTPVGIYRDVFSTGENRCLGTFDEYAITAL